MPSPNASDSVKTNGHPAAATNGHPAGDDAVPLPDAEPRRNVLGGDLAECGRDPVTGFFRTGCCDTGPDDRGSHTVCAVMTDDFLEFTAAAGNDLSTPRPWFPGLKAGDRWCLCAARWEEARREGVAPPVVLEATHEKALDIVELEDLQEHAAS